MRPFLLVSADFVKTGGMDYPNLALARHLAERGDSVHIATHRVDPELAAHPNIRVSLVRKPAGSYVVGSFFLDRQGRKLATRVVGEGGRVVVNGGNCRWGDVNWVHYVHAAYTPRTVGFRRRAWAALRNRLHRFEERAVIPRARLVLANSQRTGTDLIERLGLPEANVRVVYYGVDPKTFHPVTSAERRERRQALGWPEDRPVVGFVGALGDRRKGFDTLFKAWVKLCADPAWDACLVVCGTGSELPDWQSRATAGGLGDRIRFLGFRRDVPDILKACDVLAAPARYEAYGQAVHEALCCGLPALVTAHGGIAERYPTNLSDLLIRDPEGAEELADRLRQTLASLDRLRGRLAPFTADLRARTWDHMAAEVAGLID
jgi:glycosyltransferase involved in cell wall biosynthesis